MRGLSVHQPWATAIALSDPRELGEVGKGIENRDWEPWKSIVGTHIAIHATKQPFDQTDAITVGRMLYGNDAMRPEWSAWVARLTVDTGKILCVAKVAGCVRHQKELGARESQARWKIAGSLGWVLEDVRALPNPIQFRGMQGLWVVPSEVEKQICAQVNLPLSHDRRTA
jgi:hypothetical protein